MHDANPSLHTSLINLHLAQWSILHYNSASAYTANFHHGTCNRSYNFNSVSLKIQTFHVRDHLSKVCFSALFSCGSHIVTSMEKAFSTAQPPNAARDDGCLQGFGFR